MTLLYRIPQSLNDVLNEEYLPVIMDLVKNLETGMLQIKILSMVQERADPIKKEEIRKMLLQKITYLSQKIAAGPTGITKSIVTRYRPGLDEIDVDRTLEEQLGHRALEYENIYCHEKIKQKSSYVLMLDVSNSMHQEKIAVATIATGVFAQKLRNDNHGVITFAKDVNTIKDVKDPNILPALVDRMLQIKSGGSTNIRLALLKGLEMLDKTQSKIKTGIIVTDGWATTGGDPVEIAARYDRLHVLGISFGLGGSDPITNKNMAKKGRGKYIHIQRFDDLPFGIVRILTNK